MVDGIVCCWRQVWLLASYKTKNDWKRTAFLGQVTQCAQHDTTYHSKIGNTITPNLTWLNTFVGNGWGFFTQYGFCLCLDLAHFNGRQPNPAHTDHTEKAWPYKNSNKGESLREGCIDACDSIIFESTCVWDVTTYDSSEQHLKRHPTGLFKVSLYTGLNKILPRLLPAKDLLYLFVVLVHVWLV